jgi:hypothetical protein
MKEGTQNIHSEYLMTYPRDMSTGSISMMCPAITAEFSISFRAFSVLQVGAKPSSTASMSAQGYRAFKILRVRLADCFMLARIIFWDIIGRLSSI